MCGVGLWVLVLFVCDQGAHSHRLAACLHTQTLSET